MYKVEKQQLVGVWWNLVVLFGLTVATAVGQFNNIVAIDARVDGSIDALIGVSLMLLPVAVLGLIARNAYYAIGARRFPYVSLSMAAVGFGSAGGLLVQVFYDGRAVNSLEVAGVVLSVVAIGLFLKGRQSESAGEGGSHNESAVCPSGEMCLASIEDPAR